MAIHLQPFPEELTAAYVHRIGQLYLSSNESKNAGAVFHTHCNHPFYGHHLPLNNSPARMLDPGAGLGILSCAVCETAAVDVESEAFDLDSELAEYLDACLPYTQRWMAKQGLSLV
jgi:hypothetical protein